MYLASVILLDQYIVQSMLILTQDQRVVIFDKLFSVQ